MILDSRFMNELPFMLELPDGEYEIKTTKGMVKLQLNSEWYYLNTARFVEYSGKDLYVGDEQILQDIIHKNNLSNYAFTECKTFISCSFNKEFTISTEDLESVTDNECKQQIKSNIVKKDIPYQDTEELAIKADNFFENSSEEHLKQLKTDILIRKNFNQLYNLDAYYEAVNTLIKHYSFLRGHFWVHKVDANILEGVKIQDYLDGRLFQSQTIAGLVPSILPSKKKYPDISSEELTTLKERLL